MIEELRHRKLLLFGIPAIVLLFYGTAALHFSYTPDDTYIYLQFARNVVEGNGVSFNPGEPTYGVTSPLWMMIIAVGGRMGVDFYLAAKAIDLVLASLALVVFWLLAQEIIRDAGVSLCATVAFSVNAWFLRWAGSGMETSLAVLLTLATLLFCLRNEYLLAAVLAGLLTLARPEGGFMAVVILGDLAMNSVDKRRALKLGVSIILCYALTIAPWLIYALKTFGTVVPNTALGKTGWGFTLAESAETSRDVARTLLAADGTAFLVCILGGAFLLARYRGAPAGSAGRARAGYIARQSTVVLGWAAGLLLFYIASATNVVSRYLLMVTPVIVISAFGFFHEAVSLSRWRRHAQHAVIALAAVVMLQNQVFYRKYVLPGIGAFEQGMEMCLIPIGQWLGERTPGSSTVVTGDVGAVGYYSQRRVCDAAGLVTPALLPLIHGGVLPYGIIERKLYRSCCSPGYLVHRDFVPEKLKGDPELVPVLTKPFPNMYLADARTVYYTVYEVRSRAGAATEPPEARP